MTSDFQERISLHCMPEVKAMNHEFASLLKMWFGRHVASNQEGSVKFDFSIMASKFPSDNDSLSSRSRYSDLSKTPYPRLRSKKLPGGMYTYGLCFSIMIIKSGQSVSIATFKKLFIFIKQSSINERNVHKFTLFYNHG